MSSSKPSPAVSSSVLNVPNQVTIARLMLSLVLFVCLPAEYYLVSLVLFVVAAGTDWLDGYYARRYGQVTQLGRILDPFADKIIICGSFIFLAAVPQSEIAAWMAVLVVGRELLVTALRSFLEQQGADFSANMAGKLKMVLQCVAVGFSLFRLSYLDLEGSAEWQTAPPQWLNLSLVVLVWTAVFSTVYSGIGYVVAAIRMLRA